LAWNISFQTPTSPSTSPRKSISNGFTSFVGKELGRQNFTLLLRDLIAYFQSLTTQLQVEDSSPGSLVSLVTMVRKPVIDTFHKWLDAYTTYMLVIVAAYPRRELELLKY